MAEASATDEGEGFDAFLSFRGEDTRKNFTERLYEALVKNGIKAFMDNDELERGKAISEDLFKAIEKSKTAVVIFSKNYANSSWCLDELAWIDECREEKKLIVYPVFCDVDPSDLRKQKGSVGNALEQHTTNLQNERGKVEKWRKALKSIASISGWHATNYRNEYPDVIRKIIRELLEKLHPKDIVGMDSRIRKLEPYLKLGSEGVHMIAIWGSGGIGKTTLAEEVFERIRGDFQASLFVYGVREECEKIDGLTSLKKHIDKNLMNNKASMKVLIVLDDVDNETQVESLVGKVGAGSRILITTRDKNLLKGCGVGAVYEVEKLTNEEALQLFSRKAFGKNHPHRYFEEMSKEFVDYADGLPLALEVLGKLLYFHKSEKEWRAELNSLREAPDEGVTKVLRFSYDALNCEAKEIFLDIACFFKGEDESRLTKIFESCDFHPDINLGRLVARSLITITGGKVWIHDLIQQMGWEIVRKVRNNDPAMYSRLWRHEDALYVLQENMGPTDVQGIFLVSPRDEEILSDPFVNMKSLRLLKISSNVKFSESHEYYLSRKLRLLEWHGYPLKSLASSFRLERLVELNMPNGRLEQLWKEARPLENLALINLSNCQYLTETPDFSFVPNLETLILEGCKSLSELHPSIGELRYLALLNLKDCEHLKALPRTISLKSLKTFFLCRCSNLKEFPEIIGDMTTLSVLHLDGTGIEELPASFNLLTGLTSLNLSNCKNLMNLQSGILCSLTSLEGLNLSGCKSMDQLPEDIGMLESLDDLFADGTAIRELPLSIVRLKSLKRLSLSGCGLVQLPENICCLSSLQYLNLSENNFSNIPDSISQLSELKSLYLIKCSMLQSLPKHFPVNLKSVCARDCPMLTGYSKTEMTIWTSNKGFHFIDCRNSSSVDDECQMEAPLPMSNAHIDLLLPKFFEGLINKGDKFDVRFPCTTIPLWCPNWSKKSPIKIELSVEDQEDRGRRTKGFVLFVVFVVKELEHDNSDELGALRNISCHFHINKHPLQKTLEFANFRHFIFDSFGVCNYVPLEWFDGELSMSSRVIIEASFSTHALDLDLKMFGMHQVFEQDVEYISNKLAQSANDHLDLELDFSRHCKKLLDGSNILVMSGNITKLEHKKWEGESSRKHELNTWDDIPSIERKKFINETCSLLSVLFQGSFARCNPFLLVLPFPILSPWFFHHSIGNIAVCYLPPNIFNDEGWLGLELYMECEPRRSGMVEDSALEAFDLVIDLYAHGKIMLPMFTHEFKIPHQGFVAFHVPRKYFSKELNNYEGISTIFKPTTPDVGVKMCGTRLLYEQDSKLLSRGIIECIYERQSLLCSLYEGVVALLQNYRSDDDESNIALAREIPRSSRMTTYEPRERNTINALQKLFTSTEQVAKEVSTSLDAHRREYAERQAVNDSATVVLHSKSSFLENWDHIQEENLTDVSATFNHLHITAESILHSSDLQNQKETLKVLLTEFLKHRLMVTLSLRGDIVFVLKHFHPSCPYNLCLPRKEFPDLLFTHQHKSSMEVIELPPNLCSDKHWRGFVVCVSFSVKEHPSAFSEESFRILCHLESDGHCLNPIAQCSVTKDKIKWLHLRGFIWLAYIPRVMFPELDGKHILGTRLYNYCPGLIVDKFGTYLLFEEDLEGLKQTIIECCTSFVEDWDLMDQFLASEEDEGGRNSSSIDEELPMEAPLPLPKEHIDLPLPNYFEGLINDGKFFEIYLPCTTVPLWFPNWGRASPIKIELSMEDHENSGHRTKGFAIFVLFVIKELKHGDFHEEWKLKNILCHFHINKNPLQKTLDIANLKYFVFGSFGVCSYVPLEWFGGELSTSSHVIEASFSTERLDVELQMFGMHQVFEKDVENFSKKLAQSVNEQLDLELMFSPHCEQLSTTSSDIIEIEHKKWEGESSQEHTTWDDIPSIEHKNFINETYSLLSILFQGSFAGRNLFQFVFPFPILSPWFFHHSIGNVAICYLPPNICNDEGWLGLELYVKWKSHMVGSDAKVFDVDVVLHAHGKSMLSTCQLKIQTNVQSNAFVAFHIPRNYFKIDLNHYEGISAFFKPTIPDVEVKMCGTRLLYEQDSKLISKGIIERIYQIPGLLCLIHKEVIALLQNYRSDDDESNIALEQEIPQSSRMPTYEPRERNIINCLQNLFSSTEQVPKQVSTSLDQYRKEYEEGLAFDEPYTVSSHSGDPSLENWNEIQEETSTKLSATVHHLHIIAESLLPTSDSQNQMKTLKIQLQEFFKHRLLITLSLKGDIVFVLKNFHPGSPYNLCFPRKGIPEWLFDYQYSDSMVATELPPDLCSDKRWRGLVICASFSIKEHLEPFSKESFRILCRLASEGHCLNFNPQCSVTKDKIKWLYLREFIWLVYIPHVMLTELKGKRSVEARIYNFCPGLAVEKCGIRLLYENDAERLKQTIIQFCTSFVEDLDLMDQFLSSEDYVGDDHIPRVDSEQTSGTDDGAI